RSIGIIRPTGAPEREASSSTKWTSWRIFRLVGNPLFVVIVSLSFKKKEPQRHKDHKDFKSSLLCDLCVFVVLFFTFQILSKIQLFIGTGISTRRSISSQRLPYSIAPLDWGAKVKIDSLYAGLSSSLSE